VQKKVIEQTPGEGHEHYGKKLYVMLIVGSNQDEEPRTDLEELSRCVAVVEDKTILFIEQPAFKFTGQVLEEIKQLSKECLAILEAHVAVDLEIVAE